MRLSDLQKEYLFTMVQEMYHYEAQQFLNPNLLTDDEMMDFYLAYMGNPSWNHTYQVSLVG